MNSSMTFYLFYSGSCSSRVGKESRLGGSHSFCGNGRHPDGHFRRHGTKGLVRETRDPVRTLPTSAGMQNGVWMQNADA